MYTTSRTLLRRLSGSRLSFPSSTAKFSSAGGHDSYAAEAVLQRYLKLRGPPRQYAIWETDFFDQVDLIDPPFRAEHFRSLGFLSMDEVLTGIVNLKLQPEEKVEVKAAATEPTVIAPSRDTGVNTAQETEVDEALNTDVISTDGPALPDAIHAIKRTFQPSTVHRKRSIGFLARLETRHGRKIIERRRAKGRTRLAS